MFNNTEQPDPPLWVLDQLLLPSNLFFPSSFEVFLLLLVFLRLCSGGGVGENQFFFKVYVCVCTYRSYICHVHVGTNRDHQIWIWRSRQLWAAWCEVLVTKLESIVRAVSAVNHWIISPNLKKHFLPKKRVRGLCAPTLLWLWFYVPSDDWGYGNHTGTHPDITQVPNNMPPCCTYLTNQHYFHWGTLTMWFLHAFLIKDA